MPRLEKSGMQGRAVGIDQALLGVCLCVAGIEKAEIARREQRAERGIVDAVGILAAALQNYAEVGAEVWRTDLEGSLTFIWQNNTLNVETSADSADFAA